MRRPHLQLGIVTCVVVGAALIALILTRRGRPAPPQARSQVPVTTFVGSATCVRCHPAEYHLWRRSHHDLAMQPATDETVLGDLFHATFTHLGVTTTFIRRSGPSTSVIDGGSFHVRTEGPDGALEEYRVTHTFGVTPLQQYLVAFPGGRYQALGVAWDSRPAEEGGQRWFHLYPDERIPPGDPLHWTGPNQNWNFMCAECHSTNLRKGYDMERDAFDTTWSEIDVACEACHGPGARHVRWAETGESTTGGDMGLAVQLKEPGGWVMDMAAGTAAREPARESHAQVEACARCHSRRRPIVEPYVHGRPLADTHVPALLREGLYYADGQILDEVYVYGSFLQSRMYHAGVTCSDCHDPHSLALREQGNALCARCHLPDRFDTPRHHFHENDPPDCVDCHMPARTYMVVDPRRDHSFRVPRPDLSAELGTPDACTGCHADRGPAWAAEAVESWYGPRPPHYGSVLHAGRTGQAGAGPALAALADDLSQPAIVRATALSLLADHPGEVDPAAFAGRLSDEDPLVRAAALDGLRNAAADLRLRLGAPLLGDPVRAVRIQAARVLAPVITGNTPPDVRAAMERAGREYVQSMLVSAERPESHMNLGNFYGDLGDLEAAAAACEHALRLDPTFVPAYVNLADIYRAQGRDDAAAPLLRRALEIEPDTAAAHHALGLLLVRQQRLSDALAALRRAAELEPGNVRFRYVYAVALESAGRASEAMRELKSALRLHPDDRNLLDLLAEIEDGP